MGFSAAGRRATLVALGASLILLLAAEGASAQTVRCTGIFTGAAPGNLEIPEGAFCEMFNATIGGNVSALRGSSFRMEDTQVAGNISGVDNRPISIQGGNTVGGNIELDGGTGELRICGTALPNGRINVTRWRALDLDIGGGSCVFFRGGNEFVSASISRNETEFVPTATGMNVANNTYHRELRVAHNTGAAEKRVQNNRGDVLYCAGNSESFVGGPNEVAKREPPPPRGQCF